MPETPESRAEKLQRELRAFEETFKRSGLSGEISAASGAASGSFGPGTSISAGGGKSKSALLQVSKEAEEKPKTKRPRGKPTGAKHTPVYRDSRAEYISVRRSDLREIAEFGWLEEGLGAAGMFFVSGAFWLFADILVEHHSELGKYWPGIALCVLCVIFGVVLLWLARSHFRMREQRISDLFGDDSA